MIGTTNCPSQLSSTPTLKLNGAIPRVLRVRIARRVVRIVRVIHEIRLQLEMTGIDSDGDLCLVRPVGAQLAHEVARSGIEQRVVGTIRLFCVSRQTPAAPRPEAGNCLPVQIFFCVPYFSAFTIVFRLCCIMPS